MEMKGRGPMSADRLLRMLWLVVASAYALCVLAALAAGQNPSGEVTSMLSAAALMRLYEMDGE